MHFWDKLPIEKVDNTVLENLENVMNVGNDKCEKCSICQIACPMDIHEIGREHGSKAFHEDCTLCGRCAEYCPDDGVIQIKFFGIKLFGSSLAYYKNRVKKESPEGLPKGKVIWLTQIKADK